MAIILNDNIQVNAPKALDSKVQHYTITSRNNIDPNVRWAGMQVYVEDIGAGVSQWQYLNLKTTDDLSVNTAWEPFGAGDGSGGDVIQTVIASTANTSIDLSEGNIVYVNVQANTELDITNIEIGKKYSFLISMQAPPAKTVTFNATRFEKSANFSPVELTTGYVVDQELVIVDVIGITETSTNLRSRSDISGGSGISEAPIDGSPYVRQDGAWELLNVGGGLTPGNGLSEVSAGVIGLGGTLTETALININDLLQLRFEGVGSSFTANNKLLGSITPSALDFQFQDDLFDSSTKAQLNVNKTAVTLSQNQASLTSLVRLTNQGPKILGQTNASIGLEIEQLGVGNLLFNNSTKQTTFEDLSVTKAGIEYLADYSANYSSRSLVDKGYVDSVSGSSQEGYFESGTRAGFDLVVQLGDYDNSSGTNSPTIKLDDSTGTINIDRGSFQILMGFDPDTLNDVFSLKASDSYKIDLATNAISFTSGNGLFGFNNEGSINNGFLEVDSTATLSFGQTSGTIAVLEDFIPDPSINIITPAEGNINLSGSTDGHVLTIQADGSIAFEAIPSASGLEEAPENGTPYLRQNAGWVSPVVNDLSTILTAGNTSSGQDIIINDTDRIYFGGITGSYIEKTALAKTEIFGVNELSLIGNEDIELKTLSNKLLKLRSGNTVSLTVSGSPETITANAPFSVNLNNVSGTNIEGRKTAGDTFGTERALVTSKFSRTWLNIVTRTRQARISLSSWASSSTTNELNSEAAIEWQYETSGSGTHDHLATGRVIYPALTADKDWTFPDTGSRVITDIQDDDIEITDSTKGIILTSPDATRYRVTVANGGTLSVNAV